MTVELSTKLKLIRDAGTNETVIMFMKLHFLSGARISDLLKIKRKDITTNLYVTIVQGKGSLPLVVKLFEDFEFWTNYRLGSYTDIVLFNKNYFYRLYKRYNLQINNGVGNNYSVTHSARKHLARDLYSSTNSIEVAQSALGHRSSRSTEYYLEKSVVNKLHSTSVLEPVSGKVNNLIMSKYGKGTIIRLVK